MANTTTTTTPLLIPRTPTSPLDPALHTALQTTLLTPKTIHTLRQTLESETRALAWQENVKQRTLQLLASREYWKWEDLFGVVVREARGVEGDGGWEGEEGEEGGGEGDGEGKGGGEEEVQEGPNGGGAGRVDIRIPEEAVMGAAVVVRGVLGGKVELEAEGKGFWD